MKILYAEDSEELALPITLVLRSDGHQVTHVPHGAAALAQFKAEQPDLVLMDVMMPEMTGIEACRAIRSISIDKWVPVILLSALSSSEELIQGLEAGADEYLIKPVDLSVLVAQMHSMQRIVDMQNSLIGILDNVHEGIITIDQHGLIRNFNRAAERIFGFTAQEVIGHNVNMLMPEPYQSRHDGYLQHYRDTQEKKIIGIGRKVQGQRKNLEIFPMHLAVTEVNSAKGTQYIGLVRDISQEEQDREKIEHLALHDALTGLPNRTRFNHVLNSYVESRKSFALMFIDIDGFKPINDNFGHDVGDQVLITISQRLKGTISKDDIVSRLGGDEFVLILAEVISQSVVENVCKRILEKLGETMHISGRECRVGASIGAALFPANGLTGSGILSAADTAMYQAKKAGKNRLVMAS